jgi:hypothetical protein
MTGGLAIATASEFLQGEVVPYDAPYTFFMAPVSLLRPVDSALN